MIEESETVGLPLKVSVPRIREALDALADAIEIIATDGGGAADNYEIWERREVAGTCIFRLRKMLNNGHLLAADCDLRTLPVLQSAAKELAYLNFGHHLPSPEEYAGPLFLPNELGPDNRVRGADEQYEVPFWPKGLSEFSAKARRSKKKPRNRVEELARHAACSVGELRYSTKRKDWGDFPKHLRELSSRLVARKKLVEQSEVGETRAQAPADLFDAYTVAVVRFLERRYPTLSKIAEIAAGAKIDGAEMAPNTVRRVVKRLISERCANRPAPGRRGVVLTEDGLRIATMIGGKTALD